MRECNKTMKRKGKLVMENGQNGVQNKEGTFGGHECIRCGKSAAGSFLQGPFSRLVEFMRTLTLRDSCEHSTGQNLKLYTEGVPLCSQPPPATRYPPPTTHQPPENLGQRTLSQWPTRKEIISRVVLMISYCILLIDFPSPK